MILWCYQFFVPKVLSSLLESYLYPCRCAKNCALMFLWMYQNWNYYGTGISGTIPYVMCHHIVRYGTGTGTVCYRTIPYHVVRELSDAAILTSDTLPVPRADAYGTHTTHDCTVDLFIVVPRYSRQMKKVHHLTFLILCPSVRVEVVLN